MYLLLFAALSAFVADATNQPTSLVRIGALFLSDDTVTRRALKIAVNDINREDWMLRGAMLNVVEKNISNNDAMNALGHACDLLGIGMNMLVAVVPCPISITLQSLSENTHIPLLNVVDSKSCRSPSRGESYSFSTQPDTNIIANAVDEFMQASKIRNFVMVYENDRDASFVQDLTYLVSQRSKNSRFPANLFVRLDRNPDNEGDERFHQAASYLANLLHTNHVVQLRTVVLFTKADIVMKLIPMLHALTLAESLNVQWIVAGEFILAEDLRYLESSTTSKVTVISQYVPENMKIVKRFVKAWNDDLNKERCSTCPERRVSASDIPIEAFYVYDGISHVGRVLARAFIDGNYFSPSSLSCNAGQRQFWPGGKSLLKYIKKVQTGGILSKTNLSGTGTNLDANFAIIQKENGKNKNFVRKYIWNPNTSNSFQNVSKDINVTLRIATIEEAPFVTIQRSENGEVLHYDGFAIELIDALSKLVGFKYEIYEVKDQKYGERLADGAWNGLVGDVMHGKADIAVAAMTITADRESVVDFPKRFMDYSVGIVLKRPHQTADFFSFVAPFHSSVWFCIMCAFVLVVVFIYILNQISPNRVKPWDSGADKKDHISLSAVFWFACGSFMQQGSELQKITVPGRIIMGSWWLFTLIVISTYTANLAAFLTVKRMDLPIRSFHDLVKQTDIKYGTVSGTSIYNFIMRKAEESSDSSSFYNKMSRMVNDSTNQLSVAKEGFERAESGQFAFLWDVSVIEHEVINHQSCMLTTVGDSIYNKGYGFAIQHGSPYRDPLSLGILKLQDSGEIETLRRKWWPKSGKCSANKLPPASGEELTLKTFTGIFFVLAGGLTLAWIFAIGEIVFHVFNGKDYPPTAKTLRQNEIEKGQKKNDIHVTLNKKELLQQLVEYLTAVKEKENDWNSDTTAANNENTKQEDNLMISRSQTDVDNSGLPAMFEKVYCPAPRLASDQRFANGLSPCSQHYRHRRPRGTSSSNLLASISENNSDDIFTSHTLPSIFKKSEV